MSAALVSLLAITTLASLANVAHAALLAEERFLTNASPVGPEYLLGNLEGQSPTTLGFTGAWFSSNGTSPTVSAASLNYLDANFPAETGGRALSPTGNSRIHRLLAPSTNPFEPTDSGVVYMSFLLQPGTNNGYRALEMHYLGNSDGTNRTFQLGDSSFTDFVNSTTFGMRINDNAALRFSLGTEDNNVNLFLLKFNLSTTNNADSITAWRNPSLASLASDPTGGVTATGFNFAADRLGMGHFTGAQVGLDELRIGTTLQDVLTDFLTCDVNGNGVCNSTDIAIISQNMYLTGDFLHGDVDNNGIINFADYRLFKDHPARVVGFDAPGGGSVTIPEPASALLLGIAALGCCRIVVRRVRRPVSAKSFKLCLALFAGLQAMFVGLQPAHAIDLLNDNIPFSTFNLELRPYATLPTGFNDIISMTTRPGDTRMYVTTQEGGIFVVDDHGSGGTTVAPWFNVASGIDQATDRSLFGAAGHDGLQSVAFHPEFITSGSPGYGKLYTTLMETRPASVAGHKYLGDSTSGNGERDSVLLEWTYNHATGQVDPASYRELFRARLPNADHMIKQARFNQYAQPGDEDYGLLYLTHGDSSSQHSTEDRPQNLDVISGKMLRVNPLQSGGSPYTIPTTNPFYNDSDPTVLEEIYAYGFRNPHNFSFNRDDQGDVQILVGDIGRANIEEVNLVVNGGNYGWTKREGTFVHSQNPDNTLNSGYYAGVFPLPANEADLGLEYIYPVAQFDHNTNNDNTPVDQPYSGMAISSGFVIRNGSDPNLHNQFIFANFAYADGNVYHTDFDEMLGAKTTLNPGDMPSQLTQAELSRIHLSLDHDNNSNTPPQLYDEFTHLLGNGRSDTRYGEGVSGEMYISNKVNNTVYLVTNSVANNKLTLTVDRGTGDMTLTNSTGQDVTVDNLSVFSPSGSLVPGEFQSLGGDWIVSPANSPLSLNQNNAITSLTLNGATSEPLGDAYDAQLIAFGQPAGEDLQLLFSTAGPNGRNFAGNVVYTGVSTITNTIVLTVDLATGEAVMLNQTPFAQEIEGYTIASADGSLNTAGWNTLEAQGVDGGDWLASPPLATRFTELQEDGTTTFDELTPFALGQIFQSDGVLDLDFEFLLAGDGETTPGMVVYILSGDYNDDHVVDAADYTVWRDHLNTNTALPNDLTPGQVTQADYDDWKASFGAVWPGSGGGSSLASVPEPGVLILIGSALCLLVARRSRLDF